MRFCLFIVFASVISFSIVSCQKEISPYSPTGAGSDTLISDSASVKSYQPITTGSRWTYKDSTTGSVSTSTIGNFTRTINNLVHKAYLSSRGSSIDTLWIATPVPNYYLVARVLSPGTNVPFELTFYYLNDTASVGYSWQYTAGTGNGFTALGKSMIVAKGLTMVVEGKTYTNVTQTSLVLSYNVFGNVITYGTYNYFMAKGVGFIKIRSNITNPATNASVSTCSNLTDYTIN